jgi:uncharacterized membrane protein YpjA
MLWRSVGLLLALWCGLLAALWRCKRRDWVDYLHRAMPIPQRHLSVRRVSIQHSTAGTYEGTRYNDQALHGAKRTP